MPSLGNWGDGLYVYTCTQEHEKIGAWKMCAHALCEVSHNVDGHGVDCFGEDPPLGGHVLYQLCDGRPLDLFVLEVTQRVHSEIENNAALP